MSDARDVLAKILRQHWWDFRLARQEITAEWLLSALDEAGYVVVPLEDYVLGPVGLNVVMDH